MRVGTSDRVTHRIDKWEDHPHACGDKKSVAQALLSVTGSSPCVWGQADRIFNCNFVTGIIPMRVGTSRYPQLRITAVGDHPHACGDKQDNCEETKQRLGSSPCVWGQVAIEPLSIIRRRIIPMRVGTSKSSTQRFPCLWDHPHACGDKPFSFYVFLLC